MQQYLLCLIISSFILISLRCSSQASLHDSLLVKQDTILIKEGIHDKGTIVELEMEIDGLLIDETRTKAGHDFYDLLFSVWEAPQEAKNILIRVVEKPYRANLTMLEVWVNEEIVVNTRLQPRRDLIEELATGVNKSLVEYLANYSMIILQMETEDQSGSGIY